MNKCINKSTKNVEQAEAPLLTSTVEKVTSVVSTGSEEIPVVTFTAVWGSLSLDGSLRRGSALEKEFVLTTYGESR